MPEGAGDGAVGRTGLRAEYAAVLESACRLAAPTGFARCTLDCVRRLDRRRPNRMLLGHQNRGRKCNQAQ
jgi:hypothetical protein